MSHVLLIEDDRFLIDDLQTFIEFDGHTCDTCNGPDEVLAAIEGLGQYDVIILDIMMSRGTHLQDEPPEYETGELLYQRIRARFPAMAMVIISAKNFDEMQIDFANEPHVATVPKPFDSTASDLIAKLPK